MRHPLSLFLDPTLQYSEKFFFNTKHMQVRSENSRGSYQSAKNFSIAAVGLAFAALLFGWFGIAANLGGFSGIIIYYSNYYYY